MEGEGLQPAGTDVASEPLGTGFGNGDGPALWHSGRGRLALATGTANFALMSSIAATLAWRGFAEARPGTPLYSPLFDLVGPLVFSSMALWLGARALITLSHFVFADAPVMSLTSAGVLVPAITSNTIPWTAIADARVFRGRRSACLLVDLKPGSGFHTRLWPFWAATSLDIWVSDPDAACAAIHGHPNYRGAPLLVDSR